MTEFKIKEKAIIPTQNIMKPKRMSLPLVQRAKSATLSLTPQYFEIFLLRPGLDRPVNTYI